jgi:cysteine peptidase C11 family protein
MYQPWKFLIYIAADNVLYENSQVSLREIADSSLLSDVEITVQVDGPTEAMATRYKCEKGSKRLIWEAPENYTADRGDRLRDFLNAAAGNGNGHQRILLVLWGEGAGLDHVWFYGDPGSKIADNGAQLQPGEDPHRLVKAMQAIKGVPNDVLDGQNANLYVKDIELGSILLEFSKKVGRRIDILGFDACLMAMAEICYEVRASVSMVVGSDEEIPQQSWPYAQILQDLGRFPGMNANTLSTLIVSRYVEKYKIPGKSDRVSLSAMNLAGSEELASAMSRLVDAFNALANDVACKRRIFRARDASRSADEASYIDFGVFCEELMESFDEHTAVHASAKTVLFVLKNHSYIQYHRDVGEDGSFAPYGLSLYFPEVLPPDAEGLEAAASEFTVTTHAALAGKKDPPHQKKDPPHSRKDPGGGMPDPAANEDPGSVMKDPPHQKKDPPHQKKDPPHQKKFPGGAGPAPMEITSYYILWDSYVPLEFNKATGWADFLARVLADDSDQTGAGR